ncbi:YkgJ family cysteine cluster protein [Dehalogenimonas sp. THU2]|uniref:YkgJ family cysteine cluster protein n=1 Tax=Dehalogenimonas sp. THU2 TaxID=3151121 RepID=UPI0032181EA7
MSVPSILKNVFAESDLVHAEHGAELNFQNLGAKYAKYVAQAISDLKLNYPPARSFSDDELRKIVAVADVVGLDSRTRMKRFKSACSCCGWCCSKTHRIVVREEDADRISRKLKAKRADLFVFDGKDWLIKDVHPCRWWNPRNGRCAIYNDRPHTCRVWPMGINDAGENTIIPESHCNYAVMTLVYKAINILEAAGAGTQSQVPAEG